MSLLGLQLNFIQISLRLSGFSLRKLRAGLFLDQLFKGFLHGLPAAKLSRNDEARPTSALASAFFLSVCSHKIFSLPFRGLTAAC